MTAAALAMFALVLGVAAATPGPAVAAITARALSRGSRGLPQYCAGIVASDLLWLLLAAYGLTAAMARLGHWWSVLQAAGAVYLCVLAWKFWRAPIQQDPPATDRQQGRSSSATAGADWLGGFTLGMANPKVILFYVALVPGLLGHSAPSAIDLTLLLAFDALVLGGVLWAYAALGLRVRRGLRSAPALGRLNRASAVLMVAMAAFIVGR